MIKVIAKTGTAFGSNPECVKRYGIRYDQNRYPTTGQHYILEEVWALMHGSTMTNVATITAYPGGPVFIMLLSNVKLTGQFKQHKFGIGGYDGTWVEGSQEVKVGCATITLAEIKTLYNLVFLSSRDS